MRTRTSSLRSLALTVLVRLAVSAYVLFSGFRALSDDDFSRVVIAQSFAAHPSLDPSGTSWLPFPFWHYGACLAVFGSTLAVARTVAVGTGALAACGIWLSARWLGLTRSESLLGAALAATIPYAAWLGVATTPDLPNATLLLLACASLARANPRIRFFGALALLAATLSRYESWPVAIAWAGFSARDAIRRQRRSYFALAALALVGPLAWMLHGLGRHHDTLFFVKRVAAYRRALGIGNAGTLAQLLSTPQHLLLDAPELWLLVALCAGVTLARKRRTLHIRWWRPTWLLLALLAFLVIGDWRDGAPTHHVGRTLLTIWLFTCIFIAKPLSRFATSARTSRAIAASLVFGAFCLALIVPRPTTLQVDGFCPRSTEIEVGLQARATLAKGQRLAILTRDYGYFAVQAAFARPDDTVILDRHDPRHPTKPGCFDSAAELANALDAAQASWLIAPSDPKLLLPPTAKVHWRDANWVLVRRE